MDEQVEMANQLHVSPVELRAAAEHPSDFEWKNGLLKLAAELIEALQKDAARYRWLRDGNAYAPEEEVVRGWEELDELCDEGIARTAHSVAKDDTWKDQDAYGSPVD